MWLCGTLADRCSIEALDFYVATKGELFPNSIMVFVLVLVCNQCITSQVLMPTKCRTCTLCWFGCRQKIFPRRSIRKIDSVNPRCIKPLAEVMKLFDFSSILFLQDAIKPLKCVSTCGEFCLGAHMENDVCSYMGDTSIRSRTKEKHLESLWAVLSQL